MRGPEPKNPLSGPMFWDVMTITVDPAYLEAAARRASRGETDLRWTGRALAITLVVALGALLTVAAMQTRRSAPAVKRLRLQLGEEAERRTRETDLLRAEEELLRADATAARDRALRASEEGEDLADLLAGLGLAVGEAPVVGPALVVELDDAAGAGGADDPDENGRIRDRDIQEVVNALWSAGAEGIAINGQRIGALTAIREAGRAVLVDYRPLRPPYAVTAVGDAEALETAFARTETFRTFRSWVDLYGLRFAVRREKSATLPGVETTTLSYATVVRAG